MEVSNFPVTVNQVELAHDIALMGDISVVAQRHGITPTEVKILLKRPEFMKVLDEFQKVMLDEVKYYITSRAKDAVQVVEDIMGDEEVPANARLKAAQDMLDRAGLVAKNQSELKITNTYNYISNLTDDELDAMIAEISIEDV